MDANEIKYLALAELGYVAEPDFNADGDNAVNAMNLQYEYIYELALTANDWYFCEAPAILQADQEFTDGRYKYLFNLPEDLLFLRSVYTDEDMTVCRDYHIRDNKLYANYPELHILYTKEVAEPDLPHWFVDYLKYKLAAKLCYNLTGNVDLLKLMMQREQETFAIAKKSDLNSRPVKLLHMGVFTDVRN